MRNFYIFSPSFWGVKQVVFDIFRCLSNEKTEHTLKTKENK